MQTYEQLKEENAKNEAEALKEAAKLQEDEDSDIADDPKLEATPDDKSEPKGEGDSDSDDWLAEPPKEGEANGQAVPLATHIGLRTKLKTQLKDKDGVIEQKDARLAQIEAELAALKSGKVAQPVQQGVQQLVMPDPLEFGTTQEYHAAMTTYNREVVRQEIALMSQTHQVVQRQEALKKSLDTAVDAHYKRAEDFLKANNVSDERFQKAEITIREAVEAVFPGKGSLITDELIAQVGEGSEVAILYAGLNESAKAILINKLREDPRGLSAVAYLAKLAVEKSKARTNSSSGAPAPAARVRGANKGVSQIDGEALKKVYKAATKNGDYSQEAFDAKMKAKAAGVDTSTW